MTLAEAAARKLCRGMIPYDQVQHLLTSTHRGSSRRRDHAWQTTDDAGPVSKIHQSEQ